MGMKTDLRQIKSFTKRLQNTKKLNKFIQEAALEIVEVIREVLISKTPVDKTGQLKSGWGGKGTNYKVTKTPKGCRVTLYNKCSYAKHVNYGHRVKNQKDGEWLMVRKRIKVPSSHKYQTYPNASPDYYVYGHFFVERSIAEIEDGKQLQKIMDKFLDDWWEWCCNGK